MIKVFIICTFVIIRQTFASLLVTYNISKDEYGTDLFKCATSMTSNTFVGARFKKHIRKAVCEPLYFSSLSESNNNDNYVYIVKTCVKEAFPEKVDF